MAGQHPVRDAAPAVERSAPPAALPAQAPADDGLLRATDLPWAGALAGTLALAATGPGLDDDVARDTPDDPDGAGAAIADAGDVAGSVWLDYGAAGGAFALSRAAGWPEAGRIALRSLVSLAVTDAGTAGLKVVFGRARPAVDAAAAHPHDADRFDLFSIDEDDRSLPSGHTARLFALASTLDRELGDRAPWLPWVAYPVAALTGAGRVLDREHWVTDAVSGAALGLLTSRVAGRLFEDGERDAARGRSPRPWIVSGGDGFTVGVAVPTR